MAFENLETAAFWLDLMPDGTVDPIPTSEEPVLEPGEPTRAWMLKVLDREGYVQLPRTQDLDQISGLARLVNAVRQAGLPPVFAFIFDEMWRPYRRLGPVIECLLRGPHGMMPNLWAWHVDPARGEAGWAPHRDRQQMALYPDQRPKALTVWIPLTEATPLNGCMYVVPKHRDKCYGARQGSEVDFELPNIRALPASPGDSLFWTQELLHWGSRTSELSPSPRLSMSVEFQRLDEPAFSRFMIPAQEPMNFAQKLTLIGAAILNYKHMYPLEEGLEHAARRWLSLFPKVFQITWSAEGPSAQGLPSPV